MRCGSLEVLSDIAATLSMRDIDEYDTWPNGKAVALSKYSIGCMAQDDTDPWKLASGTSKQHVDHQNT